MTDGGLTTFVVVDEDGSNRSASVKFRLFASVKNALKKVRAEHKDHDARRARWLAGKSYLNEPYDIGEWKTPRMFELSYTPECGLSVVREVAL